MTIKDNIIELAQSDYKVIDAPKQQPVAEEVSATEEIVNVDESKGDAKPAKKDIKKIIIDAVPTMAKVETQFNKHVKQPLKYAEHFVKTEANEALDVIEEGFKAADRQIDYIPKRTKRFFRDAITNIRTFKI